MQDTITLDGVEYVRADRIDRPASEWQIVVTEGRWVWVGRVTRDDGDVVISGAQNVRRWGTTRGLGELVNGPLGDTVLDPYGTVRVPGRAVIALIDVSADSWAQ